MTLTRRAAMAAMTAAALAPAARAQTRGEVVVIGGGFGGATAARFVKQIAPSINVTLIEPNATYTACPFSNLVIGGLRDLSEQEFGYDGLTRSGVKIIAQTAASIDAQNRTVELADGSILSYDRLILSPGVDLRWGALEGYDEAAAEIMPHAWKAGAQTLLLRRQLEEMEDGGLVVMSAPAAPFRCPPGPYERASLIAHYLKTRKPRSKLLVLDAKDNFSKKPLFLEAWAKHYPDHLEWRGMSEDGRVASVDPASKTLQTDFETIKADVANVIPPQQAGVIAERAGVTDATGWCPIDATSFESTLQPNIHVIGDASIASPMPKSAFSANLQGKLCALAATRLLADEAPAPTVLANTCYSYTTSDEAVSIVGVYRNAEGAFSSIGDAGGLSPLGAPDSVRRAEAIQAAAWFETITSEAFG